MKLSVVVLLGLVACEGAWAQKKPIVDGNGEQWLLIECSSSPMCFKRAAEACPNGYQERQERQSMAPDGHAMMIRCK